MVRQTDRLRYHAHSGGFNLTRQARSLDEEQLRQLVAGMRSSSRQVKVTIDRWIRAKGAQTDLVDQLIDMRIALESLFLSGEVRGAAFALALRGAWYLGRDAAERKAAFARLRRAYGAGSAAVHRGEVADDGSAREALADGPSFAVAESSRCWPRGLRRPGWTSFSGWTGAVALPSTSHRRTR